MDLQDKTALITGGKRIGLLIAEELARHGANVALSYARSREEAEDGASRVRAVGRQAAAIQADLSTPEGCRAAAQFVRAEVRELASVFLVVVALAFAATLASATRRRYARVKHAAEVDFFSSTRPPGYRVGSALRLQRPRGRGRR